MGIECCRCPTSLILLLLITVLTFPLPSQSLPLRYTRQYLPPIPGYVPVYIQDGESPPDVESMVNIQNDGIKEESDHTSISNINIGQKNVVARNIDDTLRQSEEDIVRQLTAQETRLFSSSRQNKMMGHSLS